MNEINRIKASELKAGDNVGIVSDNGDNCGSVTILSIAPDTLFKDLLLVKAESYGYVITFYVAPTDLFNKLVA